MNIIKRNGEIEVFNKEKIFNAIMKSMKYGTGIIDEDTAKNISNDIERKYKENKKIPTVNNVETDVYTLLIKYNHEFTAKEYESYRSIQAYKREINTVDKPILELLNESNKDLIMENSNKNAVLSSTQRDLIAGEISKDICIRKKLPANIVQAHINGSIHFHDMDYFIQPMFNCCLVNIGDMLDNGTVINGRMVESPHTFRTACTIMTQIIAQISSGQYGGQSIDIRHLGKYLRRSKDKFMEMIKPETKEDYEQLTKLLKYELESGVQTIQYQINTLMTTNGQSPFVTLFLNIDKNDEYVEENALIIEEILKQRLKGIKNEKGIYTTPSFPKLIYVLHEHNCLEGGEYDYITELAVKCTAKRMYPDYISAEKMKEIYEGNVYSCMGCRSFLSPYKDKNGNYKFEGRFNMGVVSLNLPQIGIISGGDYDKFWEILDNRLSLVYEALMCRYKSLKGVKAKVSPIHWMYGGISRLKANDTIDKYLDNGYATLSLGYIGLYETSILMTGKSHTTEEGENFALKLMNKLKDKVIEWKKSTGIGFALYGTPAENLCYRFAEIDKNRFGIIENVTDKGYYTNSYHVDVREKINAFAKLKFESQFQKISTGGCISYVEIPNMGKNLEALKTLVNFIYHNINYAEFNTKCDCCLECGYEGELELEDNLTWKCPQCGNTNTDRMNIVRRTCGYLGENLWNDGKTKEIKNRVLHI